MKVILINGPMGVGKTTVGKYIADCFPGTAFIDPRIVRALSEGLAALQAEGKEVTLICSREDLVRRWENDQSCEWRTEKWLNISLRSLPGFMAMNHVIDTSGLPVSRVAELIMEPESAARHTSPEAEESL